jgi:N-acetylglutamate synthase-like GNAT family acetyltransferase
MYVRDARNRDEVWLLDRIEEMGLEEASFRSRDYVIAVDEETDERAGFGRVRIHKTDDGEFCELTSIGVLSAWREQGVGAHVVERLVDEAGDEGFDDVYSFTDEYDYLTQFGFTVIDDDAVPGPLRERLKAIRSDAIDPEEIVAVRIDTGEFRMPDGLRERFKRADPRGGGDDQKPTADAADELAEELGIDPDEATYKYDTGG